MQPMPPSAAHAQATRKDRHAMPIVDYRDHTGSSAEKFFKSTLFQSSHLLLGLNCLEPGQTQATHAHADQDKFYYVVEGQGEFAVADMTYQAGPGMVIWAPAGV